MPMAPKASGEPGCENTLLSDLPLVFVQGGLIPQSKEFLKFLPAKACFILGYNSSPFSFWLLHLAFIVFLPNSAKLHSDAISFSSTEFGL